MDQVSQTGPLNVFHRDVMCAARLAHRVNGDDVRVAQCSSRTCFALETPQGRGVARQLRPQDLQGDGAVQAPFVRLQHDPHSAGPEIARDFVRPQFSQALWVARASENPLLHQLGHVIGGGSKLPDNEQVTS